jgi:hypothetical protein
VPAAERVGTPVKPSVVQSGEQHPRPTTTGCPDFSSSSSSSRTDPNQGPGFGHPGSRYSRSAISSPRCFCHGIAARTSIIGAEVHTREEADRTLEASESFPMSQPIGRHMR